MSIVVDRVEAHRRVQKTDSNQKLFRMSISRGYMTSRQNSPMNCRKRE